MFHDFVRRHKAVFEQFLLETNGQDGFVQAVGKADVSIDDDRQNDSSQSLEDPDVKIGPADRSLDEDEARAASEASSADSDLDSPVKRRRRVLRNCPVDDEQADDREADEAADVVVPRRRPEAEARSVEEREGDYSLGEDEAACLAQLFPESKR